MHLFFEIALALLALLGWGLFVLERSESNRLINQNVRLQLDCAEAVRIAKHFRAAWKISDGFFWCLWIFCVVFLLLSWLREKRLLFWKGKP